MKRFNVLIIGIAYSGMLLATAPQIFSNKEGELLINSEKSWSKQTLVNLGFSLQIMPQKNNEGEQRRQQDEVVTYYVKRHEKMIFYIDVYKHKIYRIVLVNSSIPVIVDNCVKPKLTIGSSILDVISTMGTYKKLYGEDIGMYFVTGKISFHTLCSDFPLEMTEEQKKMTTQEFMRACKVDSIILMGDSGRAWK